MRLRKVDRMAADNLQWVFTINILGTSSNLSYRTRYEFLGLKPYNLLRIKSNVAHFFNYYHTVVRFATNAGHVAVSASYPFCRSTFL